MTATDTPETRLLDRIRSAAGDDSAETLREHLAGEAALRLWVAAEGLHDLDFAAAMTATCQLAMTAFALRPTAQALHAGARDPEAIAHARELLVRQAEAACALAPLVGSVEGKWRTSVVARLARMAGSVAARFAWEPIDPLLLRGFVLHASLGFRVGSWRPGREDEYAAAGESFDAAAAHWERFRRAGGIDWLLVDAIEATPAPVAAGAL